MSKIGLICEGGGMKCAYGAGILDRFLENNIKFDCCIGVSAGSANTVSFLSGQHGRNLRFYTDHIHDPRYFGIRCLLKTGGLFGIKYIYGTLSDSGGEDPLDFQALIDNPADFWCVATDAETGEPIYFHKNVFEKDNYLQVMASSSIPAVCKPVEIDGRYYFDGGISDAIPVKKALDEGCDKIVALLSKSRDFVRTPQKHRLLYSLLCRKYPNVIKDIGNRHIMYKQCRDELFRLEDEGRAFIFAPDGTVKVSTYGMNDEVNRQLYDIGQRDFDRLKDKLERFMEDS